MIVATSALYATNRLAPIESNIRQRTVSSYSHNETAEMGAESKRI